MTEPTPNPTSPEPANIETPALPTFDRLPLSPEVRRTLDEMGYRHPTPVQLAVWEPATRGQDAVVQARTGTGKTAAFGLPIVDHLVRRSTPQVQVLILCPTRELALQVSAEIERLARHKAVKVVAVYGGAPMPRQVDAIAGGAHVVVGTPGRVLDHLRRGTLDPKSVRLLVLDESDEMLSMGFERELTAILDHLPAGRQTLLFSATVPPDIERMAKNKLRSPEFITLSGDHIGALEIDHFVYMVAKDKPRALVRVLEVENPESAVIFCNTKSETEQVAQALVRQGYDADWLNGDLPQSDREKVMSATREGRLRFLVATDVAARGIDISHLTHVINYDFPQDAEGYVHRTGRTGRAGRTGTAISLVAPRDIGALYILRLTYKIRPVEKQIPSEGDLKTRAEADLCAMLVEAFAPKGAHPDDLALARRLLSHDDSEAIVAGLLRDHLGARPTSQEEASAARRATRPQRRPEPPPPPPPREERPRDRATEEAPRPAPRPRERDDRRPARFRRGGDAPTEGGPGRTPRDAPRTGTDPPRTPVAPLSTKGERPVRHSDFATWEPPEEEGDDQPILGGAGKPVEPGAREPGRRAARSEPSTEVRPTAGVVQDDPDFVEIFVNVGRRDGARAADLQKALTDRAGLEREGVRRVRVRERNSFVSVRRADLAKALAALDGATIAGKVAAAEQARERGGAEETRAKGDVDDADAQKV